MSAMANDIPRYQSWWHSQEWEPLVIRPFIFRSFSRLGSPASRPKPTCTIFTRVHQFKLSLMEASRRPPAGRDQFHWGSKCFRHDYASPFYLLVKMPQDNDINWTTRSRTQEFTAPADTEVHYTTGTSKPAASNSALTPQQPHPQQQHNRPRNSSIPKKTVVTTRIEPLKHIALSTNGSGVQNTHVFPYWNHLRTTLQQLPQTDHVPTLPSPALNAVETQTSAKHLLINYYARPSFGGKQTKRNRELGNRSDARWDREGTAKSSSDTGTENTAEHSLINPSAHIDAYVKSSPYEATGFNPEGKASGLGLLFYQCSEE